MENYWVSRKDSFVSWYVVFPKMAIKDNPEILFRFAEQFCLMCDVYGIAQLEKTSNPIATWNRQSGKRYFEHLQEVYETTGEIPFFYHNPSRETPREDRRCIIKSRICFSTVKGLQEESIDNLGELLQKIRPNLSQSCKFDYSPVNLSGKVVIPNELSPNNKWQSIFLSISLYSDIWLPFVLNLGDEDSFCLELKSNQDLANCHTPRFNNWLKAVKSIAMDWGASWKFGIEGFPKYKPMLNEDGILLDYEPE
jgi:hypothetical protein